MEHESEKTIILFRELAKVLITLEGFLGTSPIEFILSTESVINRKLDDQVFCKHLI